MRNWVSASMFWFAVLVGCLAGKADAGKRPLIFVGLLLNGQQPQHSKNALADSLSRQLLMHLQVMGETVFVPGPRELVQPCPRECQMMLAQHRHGDILRVEITQDGASDFDISYALWRFDPVTDRPLTDYPTEQKTSCDRCSTSQLFEKLTAQAGMLIESNAPATPKPSPAVLALEPARRLASPTVTNLPPRLTPREADELTQQVRNIQKDRPKQQKVEPMATEGGVRTRGQRITAALFGVMAGVSLGAGITLQILDHRLNGQPVDGNPGHVWDLTKLYGISYGAAATFGLISVLTIAIPSRSVPKSKTALYAAVNER